MAKKLHGAALKAHLAKMGVNVGGSSSTRKAKRSTKRRRKGKGKRKARKATKRRSRKGTARRSRKRRSRKSARREKVVVTGVGLRVMHHHKLSNIRHHHKLHDKVKHTLSQLR